MQGYSDPHRLPTDAWSRRASYWPRAWTLRFPRSQVVPGFDGSSIKLRSYFNVFVADLRLDSWRLDTVADTLHRWLFHNKFYCYEHVVQIVQTL